jgi:hypothetical protein
MISSYFYRIEIVMKNYSINQPTLGQQFALFLPGRRVGKKRGQSKLPISGEREKARGESKRLNLGVDLTF